MTLSVSLREDHDFHLNLNPLYPRMLCAKFLNMVNIGPVVSGKEVKCEKFTTMMPNLDNGQISEEKLT